MMIHRAIIKSSLLNFRLSLHHTQIRMVLDIAAFRPEEGGDAQKIRELQTKRFKVFLN